MAATQPVHAEPVAVSLKPGTKTVRAGETIDVSVVFDIAPTYEIRDRHAHPPAIATIVELTLPQGFEALGDWSDPPTVQSQWPDGHPVHVGRATFRRKVRVGGDVKPGQCSLGCSVFYQACNDRYCLRPVKQRMLESITVASPAESRR